jgi:hypothetical protein
MKKKKSEGLRDFIRGKGYGDMRDLEKGYGKKFG